MQLKHQRNEKGYRVGESHHRSRLSDHDVNLMRLLYEDGLKVSEIARKFECNFNTAWSIVTFRSRYGSCE